MSTAALAANALSPRSPEPAPPGPTTHLRSVPSARPAAPSARSVPAPVAAPAPLDAPRRRGRIEGATTDRLAVRACSGAELGRHAQRRRSAVPEPALRLTRRGRLLLTAVSVLVFGAAVVVLGLRVTGVLEPGPRFTHTVPVQVAPGQSLWSIAQSTNPGQDPAIVVEKIADVNNLATPADITPGQTLQIPVAR